MAVQELIPTLRELSRSQKWEVMQFLMRELESEEVMPIVQGATYEEPQDFDDTPKAEVLAGLQRALEDVKAGRLSPVEELWDDLDD